MKLLQGEKAQELILQFSDENEFEKFFEEADQQGSFVIPRSSIPSDSILRGTANGSTRSRKVRPLKIIPEGDSCRVIISEQPVYNEPQGPFEEEKRELVKPLAERLRALPVNERVMLAMRANLAERRVLMQEMNPKIQEFLLRNPRLTEPEIAWIAKNPGSAIPTLLTIIQHKEWMSTDAIRQGILTNPKTPAHILFDRIPYLSPADLLKMHYAKNLRGDIRDAVREQMKKKGIRIPQS
jgi:hypothetical protein